MKKESEEEINQEKNKNLELTKQINSLKSEKDNINNELNEAYEEIKADTKELDRLNSLVSQQTQTAPEVQNTAPQTEEKAPQVQTVEKVETVQTAQKDEFETLLNNFTAEMTKLDNSDYAMKSGLNTQEYQNSLLSSIENKGLTDSEKAQLKSVIGGLVETFNNIVNGTF